MSNYFNFSWQYRIVNHKSGNGGDDWYCLREVYYNEDGKPIGHTAPCTGSEDMQSLGQVWEMINEAMKYPPLQEEDIVNKSLSEWELNNNQSSREG